MEMLCVVAIFSIACFSVFADAARKEQEVDVLHVVRGTLLLSLQQEVSQVHQFFKVIFSFGDW